MGQVSRGLSLSGPLSVLRSPSGLLCSLRFSTASEVRVAHLNPALPSTPVLAWGLPGDCTFS